MRVNPPIYVDYPEPHMERTRQILAAHPEVRKLFGNTPYTAFFIVGIVAIQLGVAAALGDAPWWAILAISWTLGAIANHALWTLIHECTHNLVFKSSTWNQWFGILCNLPIIFPSAISFRMFHLKHHVFQGDTERDADLARPWEAKLIGHSWLGKAIWLLFFPVWQIARVPEIKGMQVFNRWVALNWIVCLAVTIPLCMTFGSGTFWYLLCSSFFSVGLHPVGARWIQEHYTVKPNQETYSYYGPLNTVAFNVGFHNEHHDLMSVPCWRLPAVRKAAPEFYDTIHWHPSWTKLLLKFIFDPTMSLNSRVHRGKQVERLLVEQPGLRSELPPVGVRPGVIDAAPASV
jgi:sphingolipid delta-4 desaturase